MKRVLSVFVLGLLLTLTAGCGSAEQSEEANTNVTAEFSQQDNVVTAIVALNIKEDSVVEIEFLDEENYRMITDDETEYELETGEYEFTITYNEVNADSSYNLFIYVNDEEFSFSYEGN